MHIIRHECDENGYSGTSQYLVTDAAEYASLLNAILADCQTGSMAQDRTLHSDSGPYDDSIEFSLLPKDPNQKYMDYFYLIVYEDCANTAAWLDAYAQTHEQSWGFG